MYPNTTPMLPSRDPLRTMKRRTLEVVDPKRPILQDNEEVYEKPKQNSSVGIVLLVFAAVVMMILLAFSKSQSTGLQSGATESHYDRESIHKSDSRISSFAKKAQRIPDEEEESSEEEESDEDEESDSGTVRDRHGHIIITKDDPMTNRYWQEILQSKVHLINLEESYSLRSDGTEYSGIVAIYCKLEWSKHKENPSKLPMFRDLVAASECNVKQQIHVPLQAVLDRTRQFDSHPNYYVKNLELGGVVFHESRCGSTLVANLLTRYNPAQHRVYSESGPPAMALLHLCDDGSCDPLRILQDTLYLMGRSDDLNENKFFIKFQSANSVKMDVFQKAFPDTPFLFVYRDPVQVMVSQLRVRNIRHSNCVRNQKRAPSHVVELFGSHSATVSAEPEDYCAAHLGAFTIIAVETLSQDGSRGIPVNYVDLPDAMWGDWLPPLLNLGKPDDLEDLKATGGAYSKGRSNGYQFQGDQEEKDAKASPAIKSAANKFMQESYDELQRLRAGLVEV